MRFLSHSNFSSKMGRSTRCIRVTYFSSYSPINQDVVRARSITHGCAFCWCQQSRDFLVFFGVGFNSHQVPFPIPILLHWFGNFFCHPLPLEWNSVTSTLNFSTTSFASYAANRPLPFHVPTDLACRRGGPFSYKVDVLQTLQAVFLLL